jgi:energy-coupling factor transporter ATP-binding protein EcfA2
MAEYLKVKMKSLRSIKKVEFELNLEPGLYAITGRNACGKSTVMAGLASIFYRDIAKRYFFNATDDDTILGFKLDEDTLVIKPEKPKWKYKSSKNKLKLNGFYEGSIIHGNRFRDANTRALFEATKVKEDSLLGADEFVYKNLGWILHDNEKHYSNKLYRYQVDFAKRAFKFKGSPYFVKMPNGKLISQFSLSTGENMLISVLHSIQYQLRRSKDYREKYLVLLDEVELALHPSALNRLVVFLTGLAKERNLAVYFSTHSVELVRQINSENIYFLKRHLNNVVEVQNPCSPAYATRSIYIHDGYDLLIIVEDQLAKRLVEWVLRKNDLNKKRLIHTVTGGGWENVINLHQDIISSNIIRSGQKVVSVLDGDVKNKFQEKFRENGLRGNLNIYFLPIQSAEKYLRNKLVDLVDFEFYNHFGDTFFKLKTLDDLMSEYKNINGIESDNSGKKLLSILKRELTRVGQNENEFYAFLTEYIVEKEKELMSKLGERIDKII